MVFYDSSNYTSDYATSYYTDKLSQIRAEIAQLRREIGDWRSAHSALASVTGLMDSICGSNQSGEVSDFFRPRHEELVSRLKKLEREEQYYAPLAEREACRLAQANAYKAHIEEEYRKQEEKKREEAAARKREAEKRKEQQLAEARKREIAEKKRVESERKATEAKFACLKKDAIVRGCVTGLRDFGAIIDIGGVDGLLHVSNMSWGRVAHPSEVVSIGQKIKVKILDVNREQKRVSLGLKQMTPNPWDSIVVGTNLSCKVVRLEDYGAFVEIAPGINGLVHVNEFSWTKRVTRPSEMLSIGQKVKVKVLSVDQEQKRISLGLKQMTPNPWDTAQDRYPIGSIIKGKVSKINMFEAFVELDDGINGMVHISQISDRYIKSAGDALKVGQVVEARVIGINIPKCRLELSLRTLPTIGNDTRLMSKYITDCDVVIDWREIWREYKMSGSRLLAYFLVALEGKGWPREKIVVAFRKDDTKLLQDNHDNIGLALITEFPECFKDVTGGKCQGGRGTILISPSYKDDPSKGVYCMRVENESISVPGLEIQVRLKDKITSLGDKSPEKSFIHLKKTGYGRNLPRVKLDLEENQKVEFKKSLVYSSQTNSPAPDQLLTIAKEIAAFMNTDGGDLYLGIDNEGYVVGVENDFNELNSVVIDGYHGSDSEYAPYKPTHDGYILKITNLVKFMLGKLAATLTNAEFVSKDGAEYVKIHVEPMIGRNMAYLGQNQDLYVRNNSSVLKLVGEDRDNYRDTRIAKSCGI